MIRLILRRYKFLHYLGFHNDDCRRRIYTTKKDYLCLRTGKTHKKIIL
jgi:hypothetical protein